MLLMGNLCKESGAGGGGPEAGRTGAVSGPARLFYVLLLSAVFFSGCAIHKFPKDAWEVPYPPKEQPVEGTILDVRTGYTISPDQLIELLSDVRVVYVSEAHDSLGAHRIQARIIRGLHEHSPSNVAVGMEMFPASAQPELDDWISGKMSDKDFEKLWAKYWTVDIEYYRLVLDVIKERGIPIIGLNADKETVRALSSHGLEELPEDIRPKIPDMDLTDIYERTFLKAIFKGHGEGVRMMDRFLLIQYLWEETMAENAARYLVSDRSRGMQLIVLAGGHHIDYGFGIPRRLFRRMPVSYLTVRPEYLSLEALPEDQLMDVDFPVLPLKAADFYWFIEYEEFKLQRMRLGVRVREEDSGLMVTAVVSGSPADEAGIAKGDILTDLNGSPLIETFDLVYLLKSMKEGDRAEVSFNRDGKPVKLSIPLRHWAPH